jgi:hypothetical protein
VPTRSFTGQNARQIRGAAKRSRDKIRHSLPRPLNNAATHRRSESRSATCIGAPASLLFNE